MNSRVLTALEFDKIKAEVEKYAITASAKEIIRNLEPYDSLYDVLNI